jgi:hypothetical protein
MYLLIAVAAAAAFTIAVLATRKVGLTPSGFDLEEVGRITHLFGSTHSATLRFFTMQRVAAPGPTELPVIQGLMWLLAHRHRLLDAVADKSKEVSCDVSVVYPTTLR